MNFVLNTQEEKKQMLSFLGMNSINDLFEDINENIKQKELLKLPKPLSELELVQEMRRISDSNADMLGYACFLGGGAYNHFIPSVVDHMISRGEFYSSYTPYQAEMSQGMLQSIFEFQSMICELTEMDVANASMYDGASAMAEAAIMAAKYTKKKGIIISKTVHPEYRQVLQTYANAFGLKVFEVEIDNGLTDIKDMELKLNNSIACVILQSPNFFGLIENLENIEVLVNKNDCKLITSVLEPISLGILKPPGDFGADIVVGEAQAFGNAMNFGGPHLGFMATKHEFLKKIPGRLSGITVDKEGERGFILTLQTREQHIRRERATSNICTNQALNALAATVYLALIGKNGLIRIAEICAQRAHYACKKVCEQKGFELRFNAPFFNEFVISCSTAPKTINQALLKKKIIGGLELGRFYEEHKNCMMFCITEMNSKEAIDKLVDTLHEVIS
jgi:glycine dehydrogenase subunit 1